MSLSTQCEAIGQTLNITDEKKKTGLVQKVTLIVKVPPRVEEKISIGDIIDDKN